MFINADGGTTKREPGNCILRSMNGTGSRKIVRPTGHGVVRKSP